MSKTAPTFSSERARYPTPGAWPRRTARRCGLTLWLTTVVSLNGGGCASGSDGHDALAEEYARRESRRIDEQSFRHARDRNRLLDGKGESVAAAAPLALDPDPTDDWQFGTMPHPIEGEKVCAVQAGIDEPGLRFVLLADTAYLISENRLVEDGFESSVRIDSGLPLALEVGAEGRVATLRVSNDRLLDLLRQGSFAVVRVTVLPAAGTAGTGGAERELESVITLEGLPPMLDELARCE